MIQKALKNYYMVKNNEKESVSKKISLIKAKDCENLDSLWKEHEKIQKNFNLQKHTIKNKTPPKFSYMDLKIKIAKEIFKECSLCPRNCKVNRNLKYGFCGVKKPLIASSYFNQNEKSPVVNTNTCEPTNTCKSNNTCEEISLCTAGFDEETPLIPSHRIFFSGCNLRCVFCQNPEISENANLGQKIAEKDLAKEIDKYRKEGSANVNFVGGEPGPDIEYIMETMKLTEENIPVVFNTNLYLSKESMGLLNGVVDLYLTDFKFGNDKCAKDLSGVSNYIKIIKQNHILAKKAGDMIVRHLILPNHIECCSFPILDWIANNLGKDTVINIMGNYQPLHKAINYSSISKPIINCEVKKVIEYAKSLGLKNIIVS